MTGIRLHLAALAAAAAAMMAWAGAGVAAPTMYDMSIFLNQPHPFATAPAPVPVAAPAAEPAPVPDDDDDEDKDDDDDGDDDDDDDDNGNNDPLEPMNRFFFDFNEILQDIVMRPISGVYNDYVPDAVRESIGNVLDNLNAPIVLANDILQGEPKRAWETTERFVVNSTLGVAGIFDVADSWLEVPPHKEDFGQTLAVWGVGEMVYLVLPLFGPSNPRDGVGKLFVDTYFDAFDIWLDNNDYDEIRYTRIGLDILDEYAGLVDELDQIKKTSVDYYAAIRSMYRQKRESDIANTTSSDLPPTIDIDYDLGD